MVRRGGEEMPVRQVSGLSLADAKGKVFLTELEKQRMANKEAGETYRDYYDKLTAKVSVLDTRIKDSLKKHEKDFLSAFKTHMFQVYQQLNELKKRTDEQELKMKRDEQLNKLQSALEWFREEAVKLGDTCQFYKKECDKWKAKAESLEDDRKFLEFQLKSAKKQIKEFSGQIAPHDITPDPLPAQFPDLSFPRLPTKVDLPNTSSASFLIQLSQRVPPHDQSFLQEVERFMTSQEHKFHESLRHLQNTLDLERRRMKSANAFKSSAIMEKSELEGLFLECVDEVRKEVMRRRAKSIMRTKYPLKSTGPQKPQDSFTPNDKRKILELLISNEQVLVFLYEKLFPYRANTYTGGQTGKQGDLGELADLAQLESEMHLRVGSETSPAPPDSQPAVGLFSHRARVLVEP